MLTAPKQAKRNRNSEVRQEMRSMVRAPPYGGGPGGKTREGEVSGEADNRWEHGWGAREALVGGVSAAVGSRRGSERVLCRSGVRWPDKIDESARDSLDSAPDLERRSHGNDR
jgi:hypothetical protein